MPNARGFWGQGAGMATLQEGAGPRQLASSLLHLPGTGRWSQELGVRVQEWEGRCPGGSLAPHGVVSFMPIQWARAGGEQREKRWGLSPSKLTGHLPKRPGKVGFRKP